MMENNYFFNKLTSKHRAEKDVLVIILLQETKNSNLYNKNYTNVKTRTSNNMFNMKKVDLDESNLTGKLQVTLLSAYTS